ncbi:MAG: peptidoglycan DD-metalloendopeptidase family protein [Alphaproteobacteria bacterium]
MAYQLLIDRMSFGDRLAHVFRERQIYVRSEGQVRFITLHPWTQILFVILGLGLSGWIAYSSLTVMFKDYVIAAKKQQYADMQTVYEDRITQMLSSVDQLNGRLLLNQDTVESKLDTVREIQTTLEVRQRQLASLMANQFGVSASGLLPSTSTDDQILTTRKNGSRLLILLEPRSGDTRFSRVPGQQSSLAADRSSEYRSLWRLKTRLRRAAQGQKAILNLLEDQANLKSAKLASLITSLGFKPSRFAPKSTLRAALGGPLIRLGAFDPNTPLTAEDQQILRISQSGKIGSAYKMALGKFPILSPLKTIGRISSGFGPRRDPFAGVSAMHVGLDVPKPLGTPVTAPAAGKVIRATWAGAYGRLIEISHDNGLTTRYGHLSKILVSIGQQVKAGQLIGRVGNTGRSTGSHLHYETRVNGKPRNPNKFIKVGKYVFQ